MIYLELISFDVADRFVNVFSSLLPFDTYEEQIRTERVKRQKYWKAINDPDFCEKLKRGNLESMDTKSLVDLLKNMSPHIQFCSPKIPYTQRSASIKGLVVMRYFYGEPSFFFTYSPDYIYRVLDIRLSVPQVNNEDFPANRSGLGAAIQHGESIFHSIPVSSIGLRSLLAKCPVTAAKIFRLLQYPTELSAHISFLHGLKGKYACCAGIFIKSTDAHSNTHLQHP